MEKDATINSEDIYTTCELLLDINKTRSRSQKMYNATVTYDVCIVFGFLCSLMVPEILKSSIARKEQLKRERLMCENMSVKGKLEFHLICSIRKDKSEYPQSKISISKNGSSIKTFFFFGEVIQDFC